MRISDWSSDVCSSDLVKFAQRVAFELCCQARNVGEFVQILVEFLRFGNLLLALRNHLDCLPHRVDLLEQVGAVMDGHPLRECGKGGREQQCGTQCFYHSLPRRSFRFSTALTPTLMDAGTTEHRV